MSRLTQPRREPPGGDAYYADIAARLGMPVSEVKQPALPVRRVCRGCGEQFVGSSDEAAMALSEHVCEAA